MLRIFVLQFIFLIALFGCTKNVAVSKNSGQQPRQNPLCSENPLSLNEKNSIIESEGFVREEFFFFLPKLCPEKRYYLTAHADENFGFEEFHNFMVKAYATDEGGVTGTFRFRIIENAQTGNFELQPMAATNLKLAYMKYFLEDNL